MSKSPMSETAAQRPLTVFVHIPKSAGQTMTHILARQFAPERTYSAPGVQRALEDLRLMPPARAQSLDLLQGHLPFGVHELLGRPAVYFTILRRPLDRVISHYYYVRRRPDHYLYEHVAGQKMSLHDYVSSGLTHELDNGQTRMLYGMDGETLPAITAAEGEQALRNLREHFRVVGLTEHFDESLLLLGARMGWKHLFYVRHNVTRERPAAEAISDETRRIIEERNAVDTELYNRAAELFRQELEAALPDLETRLRQFRRLNRFYAWYQHPALQRVLRRLRR